MLALILVELEQKSSSRSALLDEVKEGVIVLNAMSNEVVYHNAAAAAGDKHQTLDSERSENDPMNEKTMIELVKDKDCA